MFKLLTGGPGPFVFTVLVLFCVSFAPLAAQIEVGAGTCTEYATSETEFDPANAINPSDFALHLPGLGDFQFRHPGQWMEDIFTGTVQLVGEVYHKTNPQQGFYINLKLTGKLNFFSPGFPPAGHPVLNLKPSAYFSGGGSIDPMSWTYFTMISGVMYGRLDYTGASIWVANNTSSLQFGEGASGKSLRTGAFANLDFFVATQPSNGLVLPTFMNGDLTLSMGFTAADLNRLARPGTGDDFGIRTSTQGSPLTGGIGEDVKISFDFDTPSLIIESPNGTFGNLPIALGVNCFIECSPAPPTDPVFPSIFINPNYGGLLAFGPGGINPNTVILPPGGLIVTGSIDPGMNGTNFILQAFVTSPLANNGLFAASNAHMIKIF